MDTKSFKKEVKEDALETENVPQEDNKVEELDNKILSKDEEIKRLKQQLADAQKANKFKKEDIRSLVNSEGDPKLIKVGLDDFGRAVWVRADKLTDADIKRRENYIENIKQHNAKKY